MLARGIELGHGSVVAAGSVVTKSVPPYAIVGGNPAKIIRMRFADRLVDELIASRWWQYNFADFGHLRYDKPDLFLEEFRTAVDQGSIQPFTPSLTLAQDLVQLRTADQA